MILALMLALSAPTHRDAVQGVPPAFAPLTSSAFQASVTAVEKALEEKNYVEAQRAAKQLPKRAFSVYWDDHNVPSEDKAAFRSAFQRAIQDWRFQNVALAPQADIRIAFQPTLAIDALTSGPASTATFFSEVANKPRLTVFLGLNRSKPGHAATAGNVYNDVRFAIGTYLGVSSHSIPHYVMGPDDTSDAPRTLSSPELKAGSYNLLLSERLRKALANHTSVGISGSADATLSPASFSGEAIQGEQVDLPIQVSNHGSGILVMNAIGDCGCVVPESGPPVLPNANGELKVRLETREFTGPIERNVIVFTNDPKLPARIIPVRINISPRYRVLIPDGPTWVVGKGGRTTDVFVTFPDNNPMTVTHARGIGLEGVQVTYEPWSGSLPDEEMQEPSKLRHGYRLRVTVPDSIPARRSSISLAMLTTDQIFSSIYFNVQVQKGIVALPEQLFLGEVGTVPKSVTILLSRPRRPFKIRGIKLDLRHFTAMELPSEVPGEAKIKVTYDGKATFGEISGELVVSTDDPQQATVVIPVTGTAN